MKTSLLLIPSVLSLFLASCAQKSNDYDTTGGGYDTADYGTPDGVPYQPVEPVNPTYDAPAAYEDTGTATNIPSTQPSAPAVSSGSTTTHTIVRGDTLWGLSQKYKVSIDAIKQANAMTRDTVVLGQKLIIPAR